MIARRKDHWLMKADPAMRGVAVRDMEDDYSVSTDTLFVSTADLASFSSPRDFVRDTEEHIHG